MHKNELVVSTATSLFISPVDLVLAVPLVQFTLAINQFN